MVEIVTVNCRFCGHEFKPRTEHPRQCPRCWKKWPLEPPGEDEPISRELIADLDEGEER